MEEPLEYREATIGGGGERNEAEELLFAGMTVGELQVIYRRHIGASPEPAVEEIIAVQAAGGAEVTVKGVRFEVVEATAEQIRYRVLKNFE